MSNDDVSAFADFRAQMASESSSLNYLIPERGSPNDGEEIRLQTHTYTSSIGAIDTELINVESDHAYNKPWHQKLIKQPTRTLFVKKVPRETARIPVNPQPELIDVVTVDEAPPSKVNLSKAKSAMLEIERYVNSLNIDDDDDWEEQLDKSGWTQTQLRLFNTVITALDSLRLALLTIVGNDNEPILRRTHVDRAARKIRHALTYVQWETRIVQWIHNVLFSNLSKEYLIYYIDVLQTLKAKVPTLVEKMMLHTPKLDRGTTESLNILLRRPWDPTSSTLIDHKIKRLPGSPLLVLLPSTLTPTAAQYSRRMRFWNAQMSALGKVVPVHMHNFGHNMKVSEWVEVITESVQHKLTELRSTAGNRPVVLVSWNTASLIATQIALTSPIVSAVVCLGFPTMSIEGRRGEADDPLLQLKTPTLFVVGQNSPNTSLDDIEDIRDMVACETGCVYVGGADDWLRMCKRKKLKEAVTQVMVDRCILDEINLFLSGILSRGHNSSSSGHSRLQDKKRKATAAPMSPPGCKVLKSDVSDYGNVGSGGGLLMTANSARNTTENYNTFNARSGSGRKSVTETHSYNSAFSPVLSDKNKKSGLLNTTMGSMSGSIKVKASQEDNSSRLRVPQSEVLSAVDSIGGGSSALLDIPETTDTEPPNKTQYSTSPLTILPQQSTSPLTLLSQESLSPIALLSQQSTSPITLLPQHSTSPLTILPQQSGAPITLLPQQSTSPITLIPISQPQPTQTNPRGRPAKKTQAVAIPGGSICKNYQLTASR